MNGCYNNSCSNQQNVSVQTNGASNISNGQVTLNGYLYGNNNYNTGYNYYNTYVWFQWGQTTSYGNETAHQAMNYTGNFTQIVSGLYQNATYHFRAVAQGNSGIVYGQDLTFSTGAGNVGNYLSVNKTGRNLSSGNLNWSSVVSASPSDVLNFAITIQALGNQSATNVIVRDVLPANLTYQNNLVISGTSGYNYSNYNYGGSDLASGITLAQIPAGQTVTITYQAQVAPAASFSYGTTTLNNSVSVQNQNGGVAATGSVTVIVTKTGVLGATTINTGLTNNPFVDSFALPLIIAILGFWAYRSRIFGVEKWIDSRKLKNTDYKAQKELNTRITQIKASEAWPQI